MALLETKDTAGRRLFLEQRSVVHLAGGWRSAGRGALRLRKRPPGRRPRALCRVWVLCQLPS